VSLAGTSQLSLHLLSADAFEIATTKNPPRGNVEFAGIMVPLSSKLSSTPLETLARRAAVGLAFVLLSAAPLSAAEAQLQITGDTLIHDPSVIEADGRFVAFGTGHEGPTHGAIRVKTSPDGIAWTDAGVIRDGPPAWAQAALGFKPLNIWAPTVSRRGGTVFLYYCLSSFGDNASAIGLIAFDPLKPDQGWRDQGMVLISKHGDNFNAIDPFRIDGSDARAWLAFGSFWSGIKLTSLIPKRASSSPRMHRPLRSPAATAARSRPLRCSSTAESSISSSVSTNAAKAWPRPITFASAAPTGSRGRTGTRTART
jgi:hypothetical protein